MDSITYSSALLFVSSIIRTIFASGDGVGSVKSSAISPSENLCVFLIYRKGEGNTYIIYVSA